MPDTLPVLVCLMSLVNSSRLGQMSRSSRTGHCEIKSRSIGSTVGGLMRKLDICSQYKLCLSGGWNHFFQFFKFDRLSMALDLIWLLVPVAALHVF